MVYARRNACDATTARTRRDFLQFAGVSIVSVAALSTPTAHAAALVCTRAEPAVHLNVSLPEPVLDNSKPQRAIQALNPGYHGGRSVGLYSAEVQAKIETRFRTLGLRGRKPAPTCLYITDVDIRIAMPTRRIYVASELWPGTCPHTAVLAHERKHEATDDQAVRKYAPRIQQTIQDAIANLDPLEVSAEEHDAAQARLARAVQSAFDKAWVAFMSERSELQPQVDAGLEYARVTASCPDWSQVRQ